MRSFPAFIDLSDRAVVVLGGGPEALRKARLVIAAGGRPTLIAPVFAVETRAELSDQARLIAASPVRADLDGAAIVFIALDDDDAAAFWARVAKQAGALVNVVDAPSLCDFTTPSIIDRGRLTIAVSTDGAGPVFGRRLRERIEALAPARADALLAFAESRRDAVAACVPSSRRRAFWEDFFDGPAAGAILAGCEEEEAERQFQALMVRHADPQSCKSGVVHIVGAGPGDPELLTLKALRLIQSADVILYDRLVGEEILNYARRDADRLYVGKAKADHALPQEEIEAQMIALAREGKTVVRLKGGDPFVFGRGGEELASLTAAGIHAEVTPGITAATGCAASAGMALTHRDHAQAVTFMTGYATDGEDPDIDWAALARLKNTLVVYMGVGKAAAIAGRLIDEGRGPETPIAVIENGTRHNEVIVKGELRDLGALVARAGVSGPALLVIGEVASLARETLNAALSDTLRSAA